MDSLTLDKSFADYILANVLADDNVDTYYHSHPFTLLYDVTLAGLPNSMNALMDKGADPFLLQAFADISCVIQTAALSLKDDILIVLLKHSNTFVQRHKLNCKSFGTTPLMCACMTGKEMSVRHMLLYMNADPFVRCDTYDCTALTYANSSILKRMNNTLAKEMVRHILVTMWQKCLRRVLFAAKVATTLKTWYRETSYKPGVGSHYFEALQRFQQVLSQ